MITNRTIGLLTMLIVGNTETERILLPAQSGDS